MPEVGKEIKNFVEDFAQYYTDSIHEDEKPPWVILQNNPYKICWDLAIMALLVFISIAVPFRLAFIHDDDPIWVVIYATMDIMFALDIMLTFYTTVTDTTLNKEITCLKTIRISYLKGWFLIDVLSIVPLDQVL